MNATQLIDSIQQGSTSLPALIKDLLDFAHSNASLGAYTFVNNKAVEAQLAQLSQIANSTSSDLPLKGLPLIVKDNIDVEGMPTTAGSRALGDHWPNKSAPAISQLQKAGAIILGKANLHEFSLGITSNNGAFGPARNPYSSAHIPGGSSGGTAVAVAAGYVPAGIGSDTGGSLRIPAALCGVIGFRPSTGRWPSSGVVTISNTRDTLGPIASTVADCALLDAVVCNEALSLPSINLKGLRFGIPRRVFWENLAPSVEAACGAFLKTLASAGVELIEVDTGIDIEQCNHAGMIIAMCELFPNIAAYLKQHARSFDAKALVEAISSPDVKNIAASLLGPDAPPMSAYQDALDVQRPKFQQAYADCFSKHGIDAMIFPTTPLPAALIGEDDTVLLNGQQVPTFPTFARNVGPGSIVGIPGICLPIGCSTDGLPLSIALDGPVMQDRRLLSIAQAIENLLAPMPKPNFHYSNQ
jgi:indoleacetamide hydrolase